MLTFLRRFFARLKTHPNDDWSSSWTPANSEGKLKARIRALGLKPVVLRAGHPVRKVEMRGCMGDVRHSEQEGKVLRLRKHEWQDGHKSYVVDIQYNDGTTEFLPSSCVYWTYGEDGVAEYRH